MVKGPFFLFERENQRKLRIGDEIILCVFLVKIYRSKFVFSLSDIRASLEHFEVAQTAVDGVIFSQISMPL